LLLVLPIKSSFPWIEKFFFTPQELNKRKG